VYWIIAVQEVNAVDCLVGQRLTFQQGSNPDYGVKWFVPHSSSGNCQEPGTKWFVPSGEEGLYSHAAHEICIEQPDRSSPYFDGQFGLQIWADSVSRICLESDGMAGRNWALDSLCNFCFRVARALFHPLYSLTYLQNSASSFSIHSLLVIMALMPIYKHPLFV
jgi:hypothetical protein